MPNEPLPDDIRDVWQNQPVENTSVPLEEIRRKARQFEKRISRRNVREYVGAALAIAAFTFYIFQVSQPDDPRRFGPDHRRNDLYRDPNTQRAAPGSLPVDAPLTASIAFHRGELVRQRDLLRSVVWWYIGPIIPGLVVFFFGARTAAWCEVAD